MRLHELAKDLGADSKKLLAIAKELHLGVKSHSSNIPKGAEGILRAAWAEELAILAEEEAEKAAAAAPPEPEPSEATAEATAEAAQGDDESGAPVTSFQITSSADTERLAQEDVERLAAEEAERVRVEQEAAAAEASSAEPDEVEVVEPAETAETVAEVEAVEAGAEPVAADSPVAAEVTETVEADEPDTEEPAPVDDLSAAEASATVTLTVGGQAVGDDEAARREALEEEAKIVKAKTITNVPESKPRRRAKILGRIEIKPPERTEAPARTSRAPSQYDPLDPTRPAAPTGAPGPGRRKGTPGGKAADADSRVGKAGRPGKGSGEWVFDGEDNTALSAIRLGHFGGGRRRPSGRRPPMRRNSMPGARRKRRGPVERPTHPVTVRPPMGVRELADVLGIKTREILQLFPDQFDPRDKTTVLHEEHLHELAVALDRDITVLEASTAESELMLSVIARAEEAAKGDAPRAPVVAVMGHVDHGKTSLLDALRKSDVAAGEAGGITQKTSSYLVHTKDGAPVCFLDTPGHKAFTEMRARGAELTDVAVLVVAADDGPMEQTQEAIDHATAAGVPFIIAINKVDKNNADVDRVKQKLAAIGVMVEGWGGEIGVVETSATTGQGLDELVERLALETELLELHADPAKPGRGVVVDSRRDANMGIVATVVVQDGTLRAKDGVIAGTAVGRVRYMLDDQGKRVKEAGPSVPVQVFGFESPPEAGSTLLSVSDLNQARVVARERIEANKVELTAPSDIVTLENLFDQIAAQEVQEINVVLKADVSGSLEVLRRTVEEISHPEVRFKVIRSGVGSISEEDVVLSQTAEAFIIGFGVRPDSNARKAVTRTGVEVKFYDVIYAMTEDLEKALEGRLGTESVESVTGHATIRAVFKSSKLGNIAGCYVTDGTATRDSHARLMRDGKVLWSGQLDSLRRFTDDVREVRETYECGIHLKNYDDIKVDDTLEFFDVTEVQRTLESTAAPSSDS